MQCQTTDTLCFPVEKIRKVLIAADQKKAADSLLKIAEAQVRQLQNTINLLEEKDAELRPQYEAQIANLNSQIELYKDQITTYEKLLRKARRGKRWATIGGIVTTGVAIYLGSK